MSDHAQPPAGAPPSPSEQQLGRSGRVHELRRRQLPRAILVGMVIGVVAVAFRRGLEEAEALRHALVAFAWAHQPWGLALPVLVGAVGAAFAVQLVRRVAPEASGSGIPHVKNVLHGRRTMRRRILPVKFAGGIVGIGSGLVMGREGPTIQMGAVVGHLVGGWFTITARERRTLVAAGAGAGLAAAFNAPLAGLVFVLEELQGDFSPAVFSATLVAAAVADVTTRVLLGQLPVFHVETVGIPGLATVPAALLLGFGAAAVGVAFNRCLVASLDFYGGIRLVPPWGAAALVGALLGGLGLAVPGVLGGGDSLVESILAGEVSAGALPALFALRFVLTMASYGTGAPGGIFAPLLALGAAYGAAAGHAATSFLPDAAGHISTFAVVGMAACFAAIVRAPLTGVVLMVEMTGNYGLVLPLMAASLAAYGIADYWRDLPVYDALLQRDLAASARQRNASSPPAAE